MWKFMTYFSVSSRVITEEAKKLWFEVEILKPEKNFFVVKWNWKEVYFKSNDTLWWSSLWTKIASDKELTYIFLERNWIKTPKSMYLKKEDFEDFDINKTKLSFPLVTKPVNEWHWNWVTVWIKSKKELDYGLKEAFKFWNPVIIQEFIEWDEQRIVVIWDKVVLGIKRIPAFVIWDWINTIKKLIEIKNENPLRWDWYNKPLSYIKENDILINYIWNSWLKLDSICKKWENIRLRGVSNIWAGWTFIDITNNMCQELKDECVKVAKLLWMELVWIDVITKNLWLWLKESGWAIIEINNCPWFWWDREFTWVNTWLELLKYKFWI